MIDNIKNGMTQKLGPLPVWAWVGVPAGVYVLYSYYQASKEPDTPVVDGGGSDGTVEEDYGINTGGSYLPSYGAAPDGTSNLPTPAMPEFTNETWFRQASNWLIGEGVTPTDVVTALNAYLYGTPEEITSTQGDALQRVLMKYGPAPSPAFIPKIKTSTTTPKPVIATPVEGVTACSTDDDLPNGWICSNGVAVKAPAGSI